LFVHSFEAVTRPLNAAITARYAIILNYCARVIVATAGSCALIITNSTHVPVATVGACARAITN
jgi:hypothetical protein